VTDTLPPTIHITTGSFTDLTYQLVGGNKTEEEEWSEIELTHRYGTANFFLVEQMMQNTTATCDDMCDGENIEVNPAELYQGNCNGTFLMYNEDDEVWEETTGTGTLVDLDDPDDTTQDDLAMDHGTWAIKYSCTDRANHTTSKCRTIDIPYIPTPSPTPYPTPHPTPYPTPSCVPCEITEWTSYHCTESCGTGGPNAKGGLRLETRKIKRNPYSDDGLPQSHCPTASKCPGQMDQTSPGVDGVRNHACDDYQTGNYSVGGHVFGKTNDNKCRASQFPDPGTSDTTEWMVLTRQVACNTQACKNCDFNLTNHTACSRTCGGGHMTHAYEFSHAEQSINRLHGGDGEYVGSQLSFHIGHKSDSNLTTFTDGDDVTHNYTGAMCAAAGQKCSGAELALGHCDPIGNFAIQTTCSEHACPIDCVLSNKTYFVPEDAFSHRQGEFFSEATKQVATPLSVATRQPFDVTWTQASGGTDLNWTKCSQWDSAHCPLPCAKVTVADGKMVELFETDEQIGQLTLDDDSILEIQGGSLTVETTVDASGNDNTTASCCAGLSASIGHHINDAASCVPDNQGHAEFTTEQCEPTSYACKTESSQPDCSLVPYPNDFFSYKQCLIDNILLIDNYKNILCALAPYPNAHFTYEQCTLTVGNVYFVLLLEHYPEIQGLYSSCGSIGSRAWTKDIITHPQFGGKQCPPEHGNDQCTPCSPCQQPHTRVPTTYFPNL